MSIMTKDLTTRAACWGLWIKLVFFWAILCGKCEGDESNIVEGRIYSILILDLPGCNLDDGKAENRLKCYPTTSWVVENGCKSEYRLEWSVCRERMGFSSPFSLTDNCCLETDAARICRENKDVTSHTYQSWGARQMPKFGGNLACTCSNCEKYLDPVQYPNRVEGQKLYDEAKAQARNSWGCYAFSRSEWCNQACYEAKTTQTSTDALYLSYINKYIKPCVISSTPPTGNENPEMTGIGKYCNSADPPSGDGLLHHKGYNWYEDTLCVCRPGELKVTLGHFPPQNELDTHKWYQRCESCPAGKYSVGAWSDTTVRDWEDRAQRMIEMNPTPVNTMLQTYTAEKMAEMDQYTVNIDTLDMADVQNNRIFNCFPPLPEGDATLTSTVTFIVDGELRYWTSNQHCWRKERQPGSSNYVRCDPSKPEHVTIQAERGCTQQYSCLDCPAATWQENEGKDYCNQCAMGTYPHQTTELAATQTGIDYALTCYYCGAHLHGIGKYQTYSTLYEEDCKYCPSNTQLDTKSYTCKDCPAYSHRTSDSSFACECLPNAIDIEIYSSDDRYARKLRGDCTMCHLGQYPKYPFFSPTATDTNECLCPAGTSSSQGICRRNCADGEEDSGTCQYCDYNRYQTRSTTPGVQECKVCENSEFANRGGHYCKFCGSGFLTKSKQVPYIENALRMTHVWTKFAGQTCDCASQMNAFENPGTETFEGNCLYCSLPFGFYDGYSTNSFESPSEFHCFTSTDPYADSRDWWLSACKDSYDTSKQKAGGCFIHDQKQIPRFAFPQRFDVTYYNYRQIGGFMGGSHLAKDLYTMWDYETKCDAYQPKIFLPEWHRDAAPYLADRDKWKENDQAAFTARQVGKSPNLKAIWEAKLFPPGKDATSDGFDETDGSYTFADQEKWLFYNPLAGDDKAYTCGFVETFVNGTWGKICPKNTRNTRDTGRPFAKQMCTEFLRIQGKPIPSNQKFFAAYGKKTNPMIDLLNNYDEEAWVHYNAKSDIGFVSYGSFTELQKISRFSRENINPLTTMRHHSVQSFLDWENKLDRQIHFKNVECKPLPLYFDAGKKYEVMTPFFDHEFFRPELSKIFEYFKCPNARTPLKENHPLIQKIYNADPFGYNENYITLPYFKITRNPLEPCYYLDDTNFDVTGCVITDRRGNDILPELRLTTQVSSPTIEQKTDDQKYKILFLIESFNCVKEHISLPPGTISNSDSVWLEYQNMVNPNNAYNIAWRQQHHITEVDSTDAVLQFFDTYPTTSQILDPDSHGELDDAWRDCNKEDVPESEKSTETCDSYLAVCCQGIAGNDDEFVIDPQNTAGDGQGPRIEPIHSTNPQNYNYKYCEKCPVNEINDGADASTSCVPCAADKFANLETNQCDTCRGGYGMSVDPVTTERTCTMCEAGKYKPGVDSYATSGCLDCDIDRREYSPSGLHRCEQCPHGKFTSDGKAADTKDVPCHYCTLWEGVTCTSSKEPGTLWGDDYFCTNFVYATGNPVLHPPPRFGFAQAKTSAPASDDGARPAGCVQCTAGKFHNGLFHLHPRAIGTDFAFNEDAHQCHECPAGKYSDTEAATTCKNCNIGKTSTKGSAICNSLCTNHGVMIYTNPQTGVAACIECGKEGGVYENYYAPPDTTRTDECLVCPEGKFNNIAGATECRDCEACPVGYYYPLDAGTCQKPAESCVKCDACPAGEIRVGCRNFVTSSTTNPAGICMPAELLTPTPICPSRDTVRDTDLLDPTKLERAEWVSNYGLGGYTFRELFGKSEFQVDFQCREVCDGRTGVEVIDTSTDQTTTLYGVTDTGQCDGPHACNVHACTMLSGTATTSVDFRVPKTCPVELPYEWYPSGVIADFIEARQQQCVTCEACGCRDESKRNCQSNFDVQNWGRGCAKECSMLLCPLSTIFDWTRYDTALTLVDRCVSCSELTDSRLCSTQDYLNLRLDFFDISGLQPLLIFSGCIAKEENQVMTSVTYGSCMLCPRPRQITGQQDEYLGGCNGAGIPLYFNCLTRSSNEESIELYQYTGYSGIIYCQLQPCQNDNTGVESNGAVCNTKCTRRRCEENEIHLPCSLPHQSRCVASHSTLLSLIAMERSIISNHPPLRIDKLGRSMNSHFHTPLHLNLLEERYVSKPQLVGSFENYLVSLVNRQDELTTCIWNARDIRDMKMNPGGNQYYFMGVVVDCLEISDLDLEVAGGVEFPLLPTQNTVQRPLAYRLYLNSPARIIKYHTEESAGFVRDDGWYNHSYVNGIRPPDLNSYGPVGDFGLDLFFYSQHKAHAVFYMTHLTGRSITKSEVLEPLVSAGTELRWYITIMALSVLGNQHQVILDTSPSNSLLHRGQISEDLTIVTTSGIPLSRMSVSYNADQCLFGLTIKQGITSAAAAEFFLHTKNVEWYELTPWQLEKSHIPAMEFRFLHREVLVGSLHYKIPTFPYEHLVTDVVHEALPITNIITRGRACLLYELTELSVYCVQNEAKTTATLRHQIYTAPQFYGIRTGHVVFCNSSTSTDYMLLILVLLTDLSRTTQIQLTVSLDIMSTTPTIVSPSTLNLNQAQILHAQNNNVYVIHDTPRFTKILSRRQIVIENGEIRAIQRESRDVLLALALSPLRPYSTWILESWKGNLLLIVTSSDAVQIILYDSKSLAKLSAVVQVFSSGVMEGFNFEIEVEHFFPSYLLLEKQAKIVFGLKNLLVLIDMSLPLPLSAEVQQIQSSYLTNTAFRSIQQSIIVYSYNIARTYPSLSDTSCPNSWELKTSTVEGLETHSYPLINGCVVSCLQTKKCTGFIYSTSAQKCNLYTTSNITSASATSLSICYKSETSYARLTTATFGGLIVNTPSVIKLHTFVLGSTVWSNSITPTTPTNYIFRAHPWTIDLTCTSQPTAFTGNQNETTWVSQLNAFHALQGITTLAADNFRPSLLLSDFDGLYVTAFQNSPADNTKGMAYTIFVLKSQCSSLSRFRLWDFQLNTNIPNPNTSAWVDVTMGLEGNIASDGCPDGEVFAIIQFNHITLDIYYTMTTSFTKDALLCVKASTQFDEQYTRLSLGNYVGLTLGYGVMITSIKYTSIPMLLANCKGNLDHNIQNIAIQGTWKKFSKIVSTSTLHESPSLHFFVTASRQDRTYAENRIILDNWQVVPLLSISQPFEFPPQCVEGYAFDPDLDKCRTCDKGTFSNNSRAIFPCMQCPDSHFAPSVGSTGCDLCPLGYTHTDLFDGCQTQKGGLTKDGRTCQSEAQYNMNTLTCEPKCSQPDRGYDRTTGQCKICPTGYGGNLDTGVCSLCLSGKYSDTGQCLECAAGKFTATNGKSICTNCPEATYQNSTGQSVCVDCFLDENYDPEHLPTGSVSALSACLCVGKYTDSPYEGTCKRLPDNSVMKLVDGNKSIVCVAGYTQNLSHTPYLQCISCPPGTYSDANSTCQPCPENYYAPFANSMRCRPCEVNQVSNVERTECIWSFTPNSRRLLQSDESDTSNTPITQPELSFESVLPDCIELCNTWRCIEIDTSYCHAYIESCPAGQILWQHIVMDVTIGHYMSRSPEEQILNPIPWQSRAWYACIECIVGLYCPAGISFHTMKLQDETNIRLQQNFTRDTDNSILIIGGDGVIYNASAGSMLWIQPPSIKKCPEGYATRIRNATDLSACQYITNLQLTYNAVLGSGEENNYIFMTYRCEEGYMGSDTQNDVLYIHETSAWTASSYCRCIVFDSCGVCLGDNSTCMGCDGIPNSSAMLDACNVCEGDNSTCMGCDGIPNSSAMLDACGVCEGDNSLCAGCDGIPWSGAVLDKCGVCNGNSKSCIPVDRLITEVYLPTLLELNTLGLNNTELQQSNSGISPYRGSNLHDWERLHTTIQISAVSPSYDGCYYRIRMGQTMQFLGTASEHLGCTLQLSNAIGQCTLEIPILLANTNRRLYIGAEVVSPLLSFQGQTEEDIFRCQWPDASEDSIVVVLAPHTILHECEENFYWSETNQECEACTVGEIRDICPPGEYIAGCDVLLNSVDGSNCEACSLPTGISVNDFESNYDWEEDAICSIKCKLGTLWQDSSGICQPCTTFLQCDVGQEFETCNSYADGHCKGCPEIQRGIYSDNEEYSLPGNCSITRCKGGFFRNTATNTCERCRGIGELKLALEQVRELDQYYQFRACSTFDNSFFEYCNLANLGVTNTLDPPHFNYIGDATSFDTSCSFQCEVGYQAEYNLENFLGCSPCLNQALCWPSPEESPSTFAVSSNYYRYVANNISDTCGIECNRDNHFYTILLSSSDQTRWSFEPFLYICIECNEAALVCQTGQYARVDIEHRCVCNNCLSRYSANTNHVFISAGTLNEPYSCNEGCMSGFYDDFGTCQSITSDSVMITRCQPHEFRLPATASTDATCEKCSNCNGRRLIQTCSFEHNVICEDCPQIQQEGVVYTHDNCTMSCASGWTLIHREGGQWECHDCKQTTSICSPGTFLNTENPTSCSDCIVCPSIPDNATFTSGCAWRCPDGYELVQDNPKSYCLPQNTNMVVPRPLMLVKQLVCDAGMKLAIEGNTYVCRPCSEITPLRTEIATWQWKLTPCDEPGQQGWECMTGYFQYQEFIELPYWDRPLPECLTESQRTARRNANMQLITNSQKSSTSFTPIETPKSFLSTGEAIGIVFVSIAIVVVIIYLACRGRPNDDINIQG